MSFVINPRTNRKITVGSAIYNRLLARGEIEAPTQRSKAYGALQQATLPVINQGSRPRTGQFSSVNQPRTRLPPTRVARAPPVRGPPIKLPKQPVYEEQYTEYEEYDDYDDYVKPKKDPKQKINSILNSSVKALKQIENESLPEDEEQIKQKLVELLKQQNNKYINKFIG